jgi:hypothetical protein
MGIPAADTTVTPCSSGRSMVSGPVPLCLRARTCTEKVEQYRLCTLRDLARKGAARFAHSERTLQVPSTGISATPFPFAASTETRQILRFLKLSVLPPHNFFGEKFGLLGMFLFPRGFNFFVEVGCQFLNFIV